MHCVLRSKGVPTSFKSIMSAVGTPSCVTNWTGDLAAYATVPAQPLAYIKGMSNSGRSAQQQAKGCWLKAASHARLRMRFDDEHSVCKLELHLKDSLLCSICVSERTLKLHLASMLNPHSSLLIIQPKQQAGRTAAVCYCFRFLDREDCDSFKAALHVTLTQAAHRRQHQQQRPGSQVVRQELLQQHMEETAPCTTTAATLSSMPVLPGCQAAPAHPAAIKALIKVWRDDSNPVTCPHIFYNFCQANQRLLLLPSSSCIAGTLYGMIASHTALGSTNAECSSCLCTITGALLTMVQSYLQDPAFHEFVQHVDACWDEVEVELHEGQLSG